MKFLVKHDDLKLSISLLHIQELRDKGSPRHLENWSWTVQITMLEEPKRRVCAYNRIHNDRRNQYAPHIIDAHVARIYFPSAFHGRSHSPDSLNNNSNSNRLTTGLLQRRSVRLLTPSITLCQMTAVERGEHVMYKR